MKNAILFLLIIICIASCHYATVPQKAESNGVLDTTKLFISLYDFYIQKSHPKKIELFQLTYSVNVDGKTYFTYEEVLQYYSQNYSSEQIESFKKKNEERIALVKHSIENTNLVYSQNPMYAPKSFKVENFETDYLLYYFNKSLCDFGKDMISNVACEENLERKILTNLYGVDSTIESLIFSNHYKSFKNDGSIIPESLKNIIIQSLDKTKKLLSASEYEKVKNFNVSFEKRDVTLWVRTSGNTIYISPFIVRAAYLFTIDEAKRTFDFFYSHKYNLESLLYGQRTKEDIRSLNEILLRRFMESFYFIFGHELAHEYLNQRSKDIQTEKLCDCYSYRHMGQFKPGVYETILKKSIENGFASLWGVTNTCDLSERFNYLKGL